VEEFAAGVGLARLDVELERLALGIDQLDGDFLIKVAVFNEGQDRTFEGSNKGWEVKVGSLGVTLS
jgi:hypothetical protein